MPAAYLLLFRGSCHKVFTFILVMGFKASPSHRRALPPADDKSLGSRPRLKHSGVTFLRGNDV